MSDITTIAVEPSTKSDLERIHRARYPPKVPIRVSVQDLVDDRLAATEPISLDEIAASLEVDDYE
jgi:hypothetical protein